MADWKMEAEIEYCVPCGYANLAAWMTSELFQAAGTAIAISLYLYPELHLHYKNLDCNAIRTFSNLVN